MTCHENSTNGVWRDVPEHGGRYAVSEDGRVWSHRTRKILKTHKHPNGYEVFCARPDGRKGRAVLMRVHRMVAAAWVPNPDGRTVVNHKDADKANNHAANLEWMTPQENCRHAEDLGLLYRARGEQQTQAKLTDEVVAYARRVHERGHPDFGARALALRFGVCHSTMARAIKGQNWGHV